MHALPCARRERGFTLTELMIGIALIGILMTAALPEFSTWMQNTKIRTAAESVIAGLQLARNEAVRRNVNVQFAFGTGSGWAVSVPSTGTPIQARSSEEGSTQNITVTLAPAGATTVTFNSLGRTTANADASGLLTQVDVDSSALAASVSKDLRITIGTGGNVRMCDPNAPSGEPRAC